MKFIVLTGGVVGFLVAAGTDFWCDFSADRMLLDGAIGCLAGAVLFRWFWNVVLSGIRETFLARHRAAVEAAAATAAASAPKPKP